MEVWLDMKRIKSGKGRLILANYRFGNTTIIVSGNERCLHLNCVDKVQSGGDIWFVTQTINI